MVLLVWLMIKNFKVLTEKPNLFLFILSLRTRPIASENRCKLYPPEENSPKPF